MNEPIPLYWQLENEYFAAQRAWQDDGFSESSRIAYRTAFDMCKWLGAYPYQPLPSTTLP